MKYIIIPALFLLFFSCSAPVEESDGLLGTWNYTAEKAPFGFQSGKMIFFEENDTIKAELRVFGFSVAADTLVIDGNNIAFNIQVETELISVNLLMNGDEMQGEIKGSDIHIPLTMVKKYKSKKTETDSSRMDNRARDLKIKPENAYNHLADGYNEEFDVNYDIHTYYYGWYGNPEHNDHYVGWNSGIVPHVSDSTWNDAPPYPGGDDIGMPFYPEFGCYSSIDPEIINNHMDQIQKAGIGVVVLSWWGKSSYTDQSVPALLEAANKRGLKIAFHLEPFYNTSEQFLESMEYIAESYYSHPAIYKIDEKPVFYLYNSFKLDYREWNSMMDPESPTTIRNTNIDAVFISLWTTQFDGEFNVKSGFDGVYTYFASEGFSYGSTVANWEYISAFCRENNLIWVPCAGPGYVDTRIRPWNAVNTKARDKGVYYEEMFKSATDSYPDFIGITSFNEWFEGTQIEPAVPKEIPSFKYEDYEGNTPDFYLTKTKELIEASVADN